MSQFVTSDIVVQYDGKTINPTPLVSYSQQPISFGYVYGYNTDISLDGLWSGINGTGLTISGLTGIFSNQFKTLTVSSIENGSTIPIYSWSNVNIDSIRLEPNTYFSGSFLKYSVKAMSYIVPSGVMDPSNEYSFAQNEDGTVNVSHKISARGVRNGSGAFSNAIAFVQQFTGKDPFNNCAPYFVPSGSGVLLNLSENIDRANAIYSVVETYKYRTGIASGFFYTHTLDINDSFESEFRTISYDAKIYGSPVNKTADSVINNFLTNYNVKSAIQSNFGYDASNWVKNSYSATVDSGSALIEIKVGYLSGANPSGFFDYVVTHEKDIVNDVETWKVDGDFKCFGPIDYQLNQLNLFKSANKGDSNRTSGAWRGYLTGIITNSPIYTSLHNPARYFSQNFSVNEQEITGLANLKLSLTMTMGYEPTGISDLKYILNGAPNRWIYELLPSANIEGAFVVQDLQTKTSSANSFTVSCKSYDTKSALAICSGYITGMANTYISSGSSNNITAFITEEGFSTGLYDVSYTQKWLGDTINVGTGLLTLTSIGTNNINVPVRISGYNFGY